MRAAKILLASFLLRLGALLALIVGVLSAGRIAAHAQPH